MSLIKKNIDEVINLNILFEEKKIEIMKNSDKYQSEVISFVNDDVSGRKIVETVHQENEYINEMVSLESKNFKNEKNKNKIFL